MLFFKLVLLFHPNAPWMISEKDLQKVEWSGNSNYRNEESKWLLRIEKSWGEARIDKSWVRWEHAKSKVKERQSAETEIEREEARRKPNHGHKRYIFLSLFSFYFLDFELWCVWLSFTGIIGGCCHLLF